MKNKKLIKTHNSPISAQELADELEMQDIAYEFADTGLWVSGEDYDYANALLIDLEFQAEER